MNYRLNRLRWGATAATVVFLSPISASSEPTAAPNATGATPAAAADDSSAERAVATWKGGRITLADLEAVVALKLPQERITIAEPGGREQLLEDLVRFDLLVQEARERGYATRPSVIDASQNAAIEAMYKVTPRQVRMVNLPGKRKALRNKRG